MVGEMKQLAKQRQPDKNMLEHGCTCYHGIIVHHQNTVVLKLPSLTMIRL